MKAMVLKKFAPIKENPLELVELPNPEPGSEDVFIRIDVCGVCHTDLHTVEGDLPEVRLPIVPGHQVIGRVAKRGEKASRFKKGDRVGVAWLYSTDTTCAYCKRGNENLCPHARFTGYHENGGYAEYMTAPAAYALPLDGVRMSPVEIAPLMCPGIAGYAAFKLTGAQEGDKLGLYGFGPTAYYVLKVAQSLGVEVYVSTRSRHNIESARREGARWAANAATEEMPCKLDAAILFPPAGNLVEPILSQLEKGGTLVMAPVSASPIRIENYSENLWGRNIRTLYNLSRSDAEEFFKIVDRLELEMGTSPFLFKDLQDTLILARQGKLEQPNAVIKISD